MNEIKIKWCTMETGKERTNELYLLVNGGVGGGGGKARHSSLTLSAFNKGSHLMFN